MAWTVRLLILTLFIVMGVVVVRSLFLRPPAQKDLCREEGNSGEPMVQDPVCGRFLHERQAIGESFGGAVVYFCSQECRERYAALQETTEKA